MIHTLTDVEQKHIDAVAKVLHRHLYLVIPQEWREMPTWEEYRHVAEQAIDAFLFEEEEEE